MYTPIKAGVKVSENENKLIFDRLKSRLQLSNTLKINKNQKKMFFGKLDFPIFWVFFSLFSGQERPKKKIGTYSESAQRVLSIDI